MEEVFYHTYQRLSEKLTEGTQLTKKEFLSLSTEEQLNLIYVHLRTIATRAKEVLSQVKQDNSLGGVPSGFDNWWELYKKCLRLWSLGGLLQIDNYDDWYRWASNLNKVLIPFIMILYIIVLVSAGQAAVYLWPFFMFWEIFVGYFSYTYRISSSLLIREVDIVVHVVDKDDGRGVNGLEIHARSINATERCSEDQKEKFEYDLPAASYMGDGYYALSSRDRETKYLKAPPPPGLYEIWIPSEQFVNQKIYEGYTHVTLYPIPDAQCYTLEVILEGRPVS